MSNREFDLRQAVIDGDRVGVECFVADEQNEILKQWRAGERKELGPALQRSLQKSHRARWQLVRPEQEIPYQLGAWEGWLQAFHVLYEDEEREYDIVEMAVAKSPNADKIIRFLYQYGQPIRHGELAEKLGMSDSALSNAMKRVVGCGAVSASRTGRNTRYTLTPAAIQYCKKMDRWKSISRQNKKNAVLEEIARLCKQGMEETPVPAGENLPACAQGKHLAPTLEVKYFLKKPWAETAEIMTERKQPDNINQVYFSPLEKCVQLQAVDNCG